MVSIVVLSIQRFQVKLGPRVGMWDFEGRGYELVLVFHADESNPASAVLLPIHALCSLARCPILRERPSSLFSER
jgi:hypothetical protein